MADAVIVSAARTAIGTARRGSLAGFSAFDLGRLAVEEAVKRSGIPVDDIDDIVLGEVLQGGGDIARYVAIELGMIDVPGMAHNRHCASGMAAVQTAAANIRAGMDTRRRRRWHGVDHAVAERVQEAARPVLGRAAVALAEHTPRRPTHRRWTCRSPSAGTRRRSATSPARSRTTGRTTRTCARSRRPTRAASTRRSSRSTSRRGSGETRVFDVDEHPRRDTTLEKLAALPTAAPRDPGLLDHRGQLVGPQRRIVRGRDLRRRLRREPRPRAARDHPLVGVGRAAARRHRPRPDARDPEGARARRAWPLDDVDLVEINEAFASMAVASSRILGFPHEIVNVNGSGCCSGTRSRAPAPA